MHRESQLRHEGTRCGNAVIAGGILGRYFDEAERRQGVESCFHGAVEGVPARRQILDDLVGEHDDEGMRTRAFCEAQEDRAHFQVPGFAGPKRGLDRRQLLVAVMDQLFGCLRGRQVGFEHVAAIEFGGCGLRVLLDSQRQGALRSGQFDPVSDAQLFCPSNELLHSALGVGAGMLLEVVMLFGNKHLELGQF